MARPRIHDQGEILDAVERVIARDGVLTVDAVAKEAGVSKATVLYEHYNKRALVAALVARTIERDNAFNQDCATIYSGLPDAVLRGRIEAARRAGAEPGGNAVVLSLVAALIQDVELRAVFRRNQNRLREDLLDASSDPRAARLAWLALEGLKYQLHLDLIAWTDAECAEILNDIERFATQGAAAPEIDNV